MAQKRTSIYDIAQRLGVSVSSVSRALSDHPSISAALKERIRQVAEELHYTPNSVAVNLKTGRRNTIGVVVPGINRSFFVGHRGDRGPGLQTGVRRIDLSVERLGRT